MIRTKATTVAEEKPRPVDNKSTYQILLVSLLALFCARVLGQILVVFLHVHFLPPMEEWMSGAMTYPTLLISQILIIALYGKVCFDVVRSRGYFAVPRYNWGPRLNEFGILYMAVMLVRYILHNGLHSHEHWTGGSIPIFFHCVLASFLIVYGRYQLAIKASTASKLGSKERIVSAILRMSVGVGLIAWIAYTIAPAVIANQMGLKQGVFAVRATERNVGIRMRDGTVLRADIFRPTHQDKSPTILIRIPLSKSAKNLFYVDVMGRIWAEHGYCVVLQGTRGRYGSDGEFYPLKSERDDGIDTLSWLSRQPWFNGQIATWGGSAFGYTQWAIADQVNPSLSVLNIYEASTDFYKVFYPGGAFSLYSALSWTANSNGKEDRNEWPSSDEINRGASSFPMSDSDVRTVGRKVQFFQDWIKHYTNDSYWREIDGFKRSTTLKAPVLLLAGWFDPFLPTELNDFVEIRAAASPTVAKRSRLIIGPWTHAGEISFPDGSKAEPFRAKSFAVSLPWFDSILNSKDESQSPSVMIFVMGSNKWRSENEWPLSRAKQTVLYLGTTNGARWSGILQNTSSITSTTNSFTYDPQNPVPTTGGAMIGKGAGMMRQDAIEKRADVLLYSSEAMKVDTEVTGPVKVILFVDISASCTDFTAKLVDIFPNGSVFNLSDGIVREHFKPGTVKKIAVELWPTSNVFKMGHRIGLEISSSNFPRYDRNPNTDESPIACATSTVQANQSIHTGKDYPSRLIIPVIPQ